MNDDWRVGALENVHDIRRVKLLWERSFLDAERLATLVSECIIAFPSVSTELFADARVSLASVTA